MTASIVFVIPDPDVILLILHNDPLVTSLTLHTYGNKTALLDTVLATVSQYGDFTIDRIDRIDVAKMEA